MEILNVFTVPFLRLRKAIPEMLLITEIEQQFTKGRRSKYSDWILRYYKIYAAENVLNIIIVIIVKMGEA